MKTDNAKPRLAQVIGRATVSRLAASRSPSPPSRTSPPVRPATGTHLDRRPDFPEAKSELTPVASPIRVGTRDAPKALIGRSARRAWASEVNRVARATDDMTAAREAGRGWLWLRSTATRLQPHTSQGREANARRRSRSRKPPRGAKRTKAGRGIA
jgi:hypothetical protein